MDPVTALRMEQKMIPVPENYKTAGQFYSDMLDELAEDFDDECCTSATGAAKAQRRFEKFQRAVLNIRHAAATVLQRKFILGPPHQPAMDIDHTPEFENWSREELIEKILKQRAMLDSCADYLFQIHGYATEEYPEDDEEEHYHREQVAEIDEYYIGGYDAYLDDMEDERAELEEKARHAYEEYND